MMLGPSMEISRIAERYAARAPEPGDDQFRLLVSSVTDYAIYLLDPGGRIASWNAGAERIKGYRAGEVVGRHFSMFYVPEDRADGKPERALAAAMRDGRFEGQGWRVRRDGTRFWAEVVLTALRDAGGELKGFAKVTRDIHERHAAEERLRESERRFRMLVQGVTDYAIYMLSPGGEISSWNAGAQRIKGYAEREVLGRNFAMFFTAEDRAAGKPERALETARSTGRFADEGWRLRKDGSRFWASTIVSPINNETGELIGFVSVGRDLSEKRAQEQLVQRQQEEILELSTPVIQVWDKVLVLPIIGTLDSARAARLTEGLLERIAAEQAEVAILDVSGVPAVDTEVAQHLLKTVEAARLMGAVSVLSGVRPETAQAIVHLGIDLGSLRSRSNLKEALQLALSIVGATTVAVSGD